MNALEVRGLTKTFGGTPALAGVDLSVAKGEFCVVVGPSGCGKSTVLRCVAGLETPTAGAIRIDGRDVAGLEPGARDVAMVFQGYALYPHMTVAENIAFPLKMRGTPTIGRTNRVKEAAELLSIAHLLDRRPGALSGGERQRVAIGRAIVRRPALFLFDEPLSNLDAKLRVRMRAEIAALHRRLKTAVLHVTHDQAEAMALAQMLVVMNAGRVEQAGPPAEIYRRPATRFVAEFIGSPAMNFLAGRAEGGLLEAGPFRFPVPDRVAGDVEVGIRPEAFRLGYGETRARVMLVEDLGAERIVHLALGPTRLVARAGGDARFSEGDEVPFSVAPEALHLFAGGRRIDV